MNPAQAAPQQTAARATTAALPNSARRIALALAVVHVLLALLVFDPAPHTGGDNAVYVTLGRSLLEHQSYRNLYDPALPPHTQYPPVFPAILAVAMAIGINGWVGWKLAIVAFSGAAVALSYLWMRRRLQPAVALGATAVIAVAPGVLHLAHWVLSDVPFWAFTMLALWAFERTPAAARGRFAIGVAATMLAYFTRSAGLPLVLAVIGWLLLRRHWRRLAAFVAVFAPLALLWWLRARGHGGVDYVSQFWMLDPYTPTLGRAGVADLVDRVIVNEGRYLSIHLPVLLTGFAGTLLFALGVVVAVLAVFGWARRLPRPGVAELFLPLYAGLILLWPAVWSGERFLLPMLPLVVAYAAEAAVRLVRRVASLRAGLIAAALLAGAVVLIALPALVATTRDAFVCNRYWLRGEPWACLPAEWQEFYVVAERADTLLPAGAVVLSRKPSTFYVLSGRRGRNYPLTREPDEFLRFAAEAGAAYVVLDHVDQLSAMYLGPVLLKRPDAFCTVHIAELGSGILGIRETARRIPDVVEEPGVGDFGLQLPECPPDFSGLPPS